MGIACYYEGQFSYSYLEEGLSYINFFKGTVRDVSSIHLGHFVGLWRLLLVCAPTDLIEQEHPLEWCDEDNKTFQDVLLEVSWDTCSNGS